MKRGSTSVAELTMGVPVTAHLSSACRLRQALLLAVRLLRMRCASSSMTLQHWIASILLCANTPQITLHSLVYNPVHYRVQKVDCLVKS